MKQEVVDAFCSTLSQHKSESEENNGEKSILYVLTRPVDRSEFGGII